MRRNQGFTLIELVVIVVIVGILVTLAVPRFFNKTQAANLTKLKHDARIVQDASDKYYLDYGNWPYLLDDEGNRIVVSNPDRLKIIYKVQDYDESKLGQDPEKDIVLYEIDFNKLWPYIKKLDSNTVYYVAASGNPDFGITILDPQDKATKERASRPDTPSEPEPEPSDEGLRQPEEDEILVYTAADLYSIRNNPTGKYIQMADIDLSGYSNWSPIGNSSTMFNGTYDGNGFTITNLKINRPNSENQGLFGLVGSQAKIMNVALENININSGNYNGGLTGFNYGYVYNCYSTGTITGKKWTGGLVGQNNGNIENCYSTCSVSSARSAGGLIGSNHGSVKNCYATGRVTGLNTNSFNEDKNTGGLCGYSFGIVGNCYATGKVTGQRFVGGLIGFDYSSIIYNSYWDTQSSGQTSSSGGLGKTTAQMKQKSTYSSWDFHNVWENIEGQSYPFLRSNPQTPPPGMN